MAYINRRFSHERRVNFPRDNRKRLHLDFMQGSGSPIMSVSIMGPTVVASRASDAGYFASDGNFAMIGGNDLVRFAHDPSNNNVPLGYLKEEARTTFAKQTSNLTGDQWTNIGSDIPTENNTDIFGGTTADELAATATADTQVGIYQSHTGLTSDDDTAVSASIKAGTNATFVQLVWDSDGSGANGVFCNFNLTTGVSGGVTALPTLGIIRNDSIVDEGNGYFRCSLAGVINTGTVGRFSINIIDNISAAGFEAADLADNDSLIINAVGTEIGGFTTSHIPNAGGSGTSVARAKDLCDINDMSFHPGGSGSWFSQFMMPSPHRGANIFQIDDGTNTNREVQDVNNSAKLRARVFSGAGSGGGTTASAAVASNVVQKFFFGYLKDDLAASNNGTAIKTLGAVDFPVIPWTKLQIGARNSDLSPFSGYLQMLIYTTEVRFSDNILISETT